MWCSNCNITKHKESGKIKNGIKNTWNSRKQCADTGKKIFIIQFKGENFWIEKILTLLYCLNLN